MVRAEWFKDLTRQDIGSKTQQVDNMESQQVARDDYEFLEDQLTEFNFDLRI